jgi:predicted nucleotidyltransferase
MQLTIKTVKKSLRAFFETRPEIDCAYIFGSIAARRANPLSDVDIAVSLNPGMIRERAYRYGYKACLLTDLMQLLKTSRVDLVFIDRAPVLLKHRIVCSGLLLFTRNEKKRIALQVDTINKYNDMRHLRLTAGNVT